MEKITAKTKNELAQQVHENAVQHGFWAEYTSPQHFLCLVICELAEAVEAMRKGYFHFTYKTPVKEPPAIEEWRVVDGYNGDYEVSNMGNVRSCGIKKWNGHKYTTTPARVLKAGIGGTGYRTVSLRGKTKKVALLVANAFLQKECENMVVNHIDGVKTNDVVTNLEFVTSSQNNIHAYRTGLKAAASKLSYKQCCDIAHKRKSGMKYTAICKLENYGVSQSAVQRICYKYKYFTDSVEFELADAYIRLLDLAGGTGIKFSERVQHNTLVRKDKSFTENVYLLMSCVGETTEELAWVLSFTTQQLEAMAELMEFDLLEHVQLKMEYNKRRSYKHGKAF